MDKEEELGRIQDGLKKDSSSGNIGGDGNNKEDEAYIVSISRGQ